MHPCNAQSLPVTTQSHQTVDYTYDCDAVKRSAVPFCCVSVLAAGLGTFVGASVSQWSYFGVYIGLPVGAVIGTVAACALVPCDHIRERQITTCTTEPYSPDAGEQQGQELPSEPPPPYPGLRCTAPAQSRPEPHWSGDTIQDQELPSTPPPPYPGHRCTAPVQSQPEPQWSDVPIQDQEPPSAPPPPYLGTGPRCIISPLPPGYPCTAPVRSHPRAPVQSQPEPQWPAESPIPPAIQVLSDMARIGSLGAIDSRMY